MSITARPQLLGLVERVGSTFLQAFVAALVASPGTDGPGSVPWAAAFATGGFAALTAVVTTAVALLTRLRRFFVSPAADLAYRTLITFAQTLAGIAVAAFASASFAFDYDTALRTSVIAAGTALLKALVGYSSATTEGASTFVSGTAGTPSR